MTGPRAAAPISDIDSPPDQPPAEIADGDFWEARPALRHIRDFARARRIGPWALLGCVLVRLVAAVPPSLVLPPMVGGPASLNLALAVVSASGGGKGSAESAVDDAIELPHVPTFGAGSGEGIGHLFCRWDRKSGELVQHTTAVILSVPEVDTLVALKFRQASTLWPELRKAWMGEPLSWAYVSSEKRLTVKRHSYRLCVVVGVQPINAGPIIDDHGGGTPQRFLWLPAGDPDAPDIRPEEPAKWGSPLVQIGTKPPQGQQHLKVCPTAWREVDLAQLGRLRGQASEALDGHSLLAQLKAAAALALLDGRRTEVAEDDWQLAAKIRAVSDRTRAQVIATLNQAKAQSNRARGQAEADRAVVVDERLTEHATQRIGRLIMRKLDHADDWMPHATLRRMLPARDRPDFEDAITALQAAGQVAERAVLTDHPGHRGTEYRRA